MQILKLIYEIRNMNTLSSTMTGGTNYYSVDSAHKLRKIYRKMDLGPHSVVIDLYIGILNMAQNQFAELL